VAQAACFLRATTKKSSTFFIKKVHPMTWLEDVLTSKWQVIRCKRQRRRSKVSFGENCQRQSRKTSIGLTVCVQKWLVMIPYCAHQRSYAAIGPGVARIFSVGMWVHFSSPKKLTINYPLTCTVQISPIRKNCTLAPPGVHLQLSSVNLAQIIFFSALGVQLHPVQPLATPMYARPG